MKIFVLHGEDTEKSYARLKKFIDTAKERSWEIAYIDESSSIREALNSTSLFGNERFFILTDLKKLVKKELEWLNKNYLKLSGNLIIYHEGLVSATTIKNLPKDIKIEEFKLPKLLWTFLESIYPGNSKKVITDFHKIIEKDASEFVFSLIARQFKYMYLSEISPKEISLQDWQVAKLTKQADKFGEESIKEIIGLLSQIDVDVKTSKADLISSLDLLFAKYLK